ncbi:BatA domain-containing protein [Dokdonia sp. Hel_I_53]|uniref:BatA domain-containing protein n=1 Tax=Dokdonia sp. Hel_I_53 TaxID=1566287 RepID=UPI001199ED26|nr:BatA domain-containing protein [Dokdonia sp. Hel_I_53]TVZ51470.1 putative membrane protein (TIGR02226 family) [Dokdonia sp. Hel_I_53]
MQFKHPELLYALFLLIIPILIHLFQLRKFKTETFTNVAFLKKINIQTRKSNTIKKWIVLSLRMLLLGCIVIAFAQPFFTQSEEATQEKETIIYLDNSFSMQAKGSLGQLLKSAAQDLIKNVPEDKIFTLLTNDNIFRNTTIKGIRSDLLQLSYVPNQLAEDVILTRAKKEFTNKKNTEKRLILISDFQDKGVSNSIPTANLRKSYVQLTPVNSYNISIDTIYITDIKSRSFELTVQVSSLERNDVNTSVSLYNGNTLLAKGTATFEDDLTTIVTFDIENTTKIEGKVVIEDPLLPFDNTMFFTVNENKPIKVLAINGANSDYLKRIFTTPEFEFESVNVNDLNYSSIPYYNFIVANEVKNLSPALTEALKAFAKAGNIVTVILSPQSNSSNISQQLPRLGDFNALDVYSNKRLVTNINYNHPIYSNVFDSRIKNFQYPSLSSSYRVQGGDAVLKYDDGGNFITESNGIYVVTGGIDTGNSNFKNSPLIVPTFYNMARQSLDLPPLYFNTNRQTSFDIAVRLEGDEILSLRDINDIQNTLIPLQQSKGSKVSITTGREFSKAGIYDVHLEDSTIQQVSYNYPRDESILRYKRLNKEEHTNYTTSVEALFDDFKAKDSVQSLWKWFIIFALFFLFLEILILKFYK